MQDDESTTQRTSAAAVHVLLVARQQPGHLGLQLVGGERAVVRGGLLDRPLELGGHPRPRPLLHPGLSVGMAVESVQGIILDTREKGSRRETCSVLERR